MIWYYLALFIGSIFTFFFSFLPIVEELPWGVDEFLTNAIGMYNSLTVFIPFLSHILIATTIFLGYRIVMATLNVFKIYHE